MKGEEVGGKRGMEQEAMMRERKGRRREEDRCVVGGK